MKRQSEDCGVDKETSQMKCQKITNNSNNVFVKNIQALEKEKLGIKNHLIEITKKLETMHEAFKIANISEDGVNPFKKTLQSLNNEKLVEEEQLKSVEKKLGTLREALEIVAEVEENVAEDTRPGHEDVTTDQTLQEGSDEDTEIEDLDEDSQNSLKEKQKKNAQDSNIRNNNNSYSKSNITENSFTRKSKVENRAVNTKETSDRQDKLMDGQNCIIFIKEEIDEDEESKEHDSVHEYENQVDTDTTKNINEHVKDSLFPFSHITQGEFHASAQNLYQYMQQQVDSVDIATFLNDMRNYSVNLWQKQCLSVCDVMIKVQFWRNRMTTEGGGNSSEYQALSVSSEYESISSSEGKQILEKTYDRMSQSILKNYVDYCFSYPGGQFICVLGLDVSLKPKSSQTSMVAKRLLCPDIRPASKYLLSQEIKLPKWVEYKRAVVNIRKWDYQSFKWAILVALHHEAVKKNLQRIELYKQYEGELDFTDIKFPINTQEQVIQFEDQNPSLMIHILEVDDVEKRINIHWVSRYQHDRTRTPIVLLLYHIQNNWHFGWVKNYSRLMNYQRSGKKEKGFPCLYCLKFHLENMEDHCTVNQ